uniref:Uncharacterized protein n=1 Tax=Heterorhabditis bacteriophora TaxID=37862 RepID=A0A1I7XN59_HETBA
MEKNEKQGSLFSDDMAWIVYAIICVASVVVLLIVLLIIRWILKHKTRVIRQDNDPILNSSYGSGLAWMK